MANEQSVIELIFNGIDRTGQATQAALQNVGKFAGSVQSATQPVADMTAAAVKLEAGIIATGVAVVALGIKMAGDFDTAFRQISTLFEASDEDLAGFKEAILSYSSTSSMAMKDITEAISAAVGSGVKWSDSLALIATAEKLAVATRADLKSTTEVLVSTMNAYGIQTQDAGKVSDLFFQIIADGKIEMGDLSQSLANITPISAAAGVSLEEVGAAIAVLTAGGMQPSTAIDALKSAISNIIKPSKQASDMAVELGVEFNAAALKSKGLAGVLDDVARATGGNTDKMAILFGDVTGLAAVLSLTGPQAEAFAKSIESMGDSAGAVDAAFQKMTDSVDESTAKITSAMTALLIRIGAPLLDEFGGITKAIAAIFNALGASVKEGELGGLVKYVEGLMKELQATLETVAKNMPAALAGADFSGFTKGIDVVVKSIKDLFGGIDLSTVNGLQSAIELVGAAFLGLSSYVSGVIDSFKPLFDQLAGVASGLDGIDSSIFKTAGEMAGFVTQANLLAGGLIQLLPALESLVALLLLRNGAGVAGALAAAATAAGGLALAVGTAGLGAAALAGGYGIGTLLNGPIDALVTKLTGSKTTLGSWIYDLVNAAKEAENMGIKTGGAAGGVDKLGKSATVAADGADLMCTKAEEAAKGVDGLGKSATGAADGTDLMCTKAEAAAAGIYGLGNAVGGTDDILQNANKTTGLVIASYEELEGLVVSGAIVWDKTSLSFKTAEEWAKKLAAATTDTSEGTKKLAAATGEASKGITGVKTIIDETTGKVIGYEQAMTKGGAATKAIAEDTKKAEEATRKWAEEVAKMDFQEKLKLIESQTKITTATIEADAKKAVAAFESIGTSIDSTGKVLETLFGAMAGMDAFGEKWHLFKDQVEKENEHRDKAFAIQEKMMEAQIAQMEAQTQQLLKGEGLIKIDGAGLKPHLEAFMWEILSEIQVKVNKDGLKMLLGV